MKEQTLMKEGLGQKALQRVGISLERCMPGFPTNDFVEQSLQGIDQLELKQRVHHVIASLAAFLPEDFIETAALLSRIPEVWEKGDSDDPWRGFAAWPLIDYVGVHGLDHPEVALELLRNLTGLFSAEFAVRPFLKRYPAVALSRMTTWCDDPDHHVRRLASEGTRPRLPWGERLPDFVTDPSPVLDLLECLKDDSSEYVRRSIANNLNDISKDHPDRVVQTCQRWLIDSSPERKWIVRHATRTLVKSGHPEVFPLLGYTPNPKLSVESFQLDQEVLLFGDTIELSLSLKSESKVEQKFVLDYGVHFMKANGKQSMKVFKLKSLALEPGETVEVTKRHSIKPITTRTYYPGKHQIELLVNGKGDSEGGVYPYHELNKRTWMIGHYLHTQMNEFYYEC